MKPKHLLLVAVTAFVAFVAVIVASGAGLNPFGVSWDFTNAGQFGDSFGFLSSFMAATAALAAWSAYRLQSEEIRHLKESAAATQQLEHKRDFEQTFFNLMRLFRDVLSEIDIIDRRGTAYQGRDALGHILNVIRLTADRDRAALPQFEADARAFKRAYDSYRDDLAHYFRLFYHLVKFVDEAAVAEKKLYFRLIRGTLSDPEMALIGLDSMHGGGQIKLKALVERHGLLHNISEPAIRQWGMAEAFESSAFGDRTGSASAAM